MNLRLGKVTLNTYFDVLYVDINKTKKESSKFRTRSPKSPKRPSRLNIPNKKRPIVLNQSTIIRDVVQGSGDMMDIKDLLRYIEDKQKLGMIVTHP